MKKRANILLALGLSSALCFSLASVIQTNAGAEGEGTFSLDGELEESYDVGERLNLPKGTFTVDGKNYEAVTTLYNGYCGGFGNAQNGRPVHVGIYVYTDGASGRIYLHGR